MDEPDADASPPASDDPQRDPGAGDPRLGDVRPGDVRAAVWSELMAARAAVYPLPPHGHNPNFRGAGDAARQLLAALAARDLPSAGGAVLAAPDYVLRPLRKGLLERGCDLWVPPRYGSGWLRLRAGRVPAAKAASIAGAQRHGEAVAELPEGGIELVLVACVALAPDGRYLDKGYGFAVPEALAGLPRATLVHPRMLRPHLGEADGRVALYATPASAVAVDRDDAERE